LESTVAVTTQGHEVVVVQEQLVKNAPIEELVAQLVARDFEVHIPCKLHEDGTFKPVYCTRNTGAYGAYVLAYALYFRDLLTDREKAELREIFSAARYYSPALGL
jgi:hypothetical protein